jgi:hypothetical protein
MCNENVSRIKIMLKKIEKNKNQEGSKVVDGA